MANFDLDGYFAKRNGGGTDKLESLAQASQDKVNQLMAYQSSKADVITPVAKKQDNSWVTKANLNPNGFVGGAVNLAASVAQSIPAFAAETAALVPDALSYLDVSKLTDTDSAAYARYNQGLATEADTAVLNQRKGYGDGAPTTLQLFERAIAHRKSGEDLREAGNFRDIVHQGKRDRLTNELGADFQTAWNQTTDGASNVVDGNTLSGAIDAIAGASKLVVNTGKALGTNGGAVAEFAADNLVQLYAGLLGKAGKVVMGAHNAGIASGHLQTGIKRYAEVHDGALPPTEQLKDMTLAALSEAGVEQIQDLAQVGWAKAAGKGVADATRTGFKESLKNIGGAGLKGGVSEFPVEAYQTYAEGKASLKHVSDKDIYVGGAIGLGSGGLVTGGVRTISEISGTTPEKIEAKAKAEDAFREAGKTGNVDNYLNKDGKDYDPIKAVQSLFINNEHSETTPEAKQQNIDKTNAIINDLETQRTELADRVSFGTKEGIQKQIADIEASLGDLPPKQAANKQMQLELLNESLATFDDVDHDAKITKQLTSQLSGLDRQLTEVIKVRDQAMIRNKPTEASIIDAVDKADVPVDATNEESKATSQASANHVISLAMAHPGMFSDESLTRLADNAKNSLSEGQRAYLRTVSAARIAENAAKSHSTVQKEIFEGDPTVKPKPQLGIKDYVKHMAEAVSASNESKAETALHMLGKFAAVHAQKSELFNQKYEESKLPSNKGKSFQVVPVEGGGWMISPETYTKRDKKGVLTELRAVGGIEIHRGTGKVVKGVALEMAALNAAKTQLQSAYDLKFNPTTVQPPVVAATPATGVSPVVTQGTSTPIQSTGVDSTVNTGSASTLPRVQVGTTADSWINTNAQASRDLSDKLNLTEAIEGSFAEGKTVAQVINALGSKLKMFPHEEQVPFITNVRATLGIPSRGTAEGVVEFTAWKANRDSRKTAAATPTPTTAQGSAPVVAPAKSDPTKDYVGTDKDGNQVPLSEGKPYASFNTVKKAKKLNPTMRILKLKGGGFVLAPKTEKQLASEAKAKERLLKPMTAKPGFPMALHEYVAYLGGLKRSDDSGEMNEEKNIRIGNRWLFAAKGKGRTVDDIRASLEGLEDNNYIDYGLTESQVLQAIKDSLNGDGLYRPDDHDLVAELLEQHEAELAALSANELDQYYEMLAKAEALFDSNVEYTDALNAVINDYNASIAEMIDSIEALITKYETETNNETGTQAPQSAKTEEEAAEVGSEGNPIEAVAEEVGDTSGAGRLSVFQEVIDLAGKKFSDVYQKINLAAYSLKQKLGKDNKTQRPLIAVNDFLSNWPDTDGLAKFVGSELNEVQKDLLEHFHTTANGWMETITNNLVKGKVHQGNKYKIAIGKINAAVKAGKLTQVQAKKELADAKAKFEASSQKEMDEFKFKDPIQYFLLTSSDTPNVEENIKVAIAAAAYAYIAENAKTPQLKSREEVKAIFGLSEYDVIGDALVKAVSQLGNPSKVAINSMGQRVSQALGLSATEVATQDFLPRLESAFGAHVLKLLVDTGVMEQNAVPGSVIKTGLATYTNNNPSTIEQGDMNFVRMVRSPAEKIQDRKLNPLSELISDKTKGTKGVLGKLFGVEAQSTEPSWEEIPFNQKNTDNTDQGVPPALAEIIAHENATPFKVNVKVWDLMQAMDKEEFLKLAGLIDVDSGNLHWTNKLAAEAKNDALRREYDVAMDYISRLEMGEQKGGSPLKLDQPIFLNHSVWKQQRVGIDGALNPQASKLHRWLLTRDAWATEVSSTDSDMMNSFKLRVMEGLGVKTDKQANKKSLSSFEEMFNVNSTDQKTADKAKLLQAAVDGINTGNFEAIIAGVTAGGEKMHSLDALMAMASYQRAKKDGDYSFNVSMMGEVDGVTNGPMLSHLALGAGSPAGMMARLNKGGFFELDSGNQNYNVWRGGDNKQDLYESTIAAVIKAINASSTTDDFAALQKITGQLHDEEKGVLKAGRNIIKTPLTAMLFGSTVDGAIDSMFGGFMEKAYEGFETIAKMETGSAEQTTALKEYIQTLNGLIGAGTPQIPLNSDGNFLLNEFEFSSQQEAALEAVFKDSLGEAVKTTMETEFSDFLAVRDTINNTANAAFGMYWAAYEGIRKDVIAELVKSGDIAANAKDKEFHDLTAKQEALIDKRIKKINPTVHTYMSKQGSTSAKSGLHISKSARKLSQEGAYQNEVHFGTGFHVTNAFSTGTSAYQRILATPGVGMLPMMIHSIDSAISHLALMGRSVLNVHDAHGTGLNEFIKTAQELNRNTWKVLLGYSPATEMRDSFVNTLNGMDSLLASGNAESVIQELQTYLLALQKKQTKTVDKKKIIPPLNTVLAAVVTDMFSTAYMADKTKYETMANLQYVDQYALEGGQYDVTKDDRGEATKLLEGLGKNVVPAEVFAAIDRINAVVLGKKPEAKTSTKADIATTLKERGAVPAKEILRDLWTQLKAQKSSELRNFRVTLLAQLGKLVSDDLKIVWGLPKDHPSQNDPGLFRSVDGVATIYINAGISNTHLTEAILHESTHAVVHQVTTSGDKAIITELNALLNKVREFVSTPEFKNENTADFSTILAGENGIHELVAWGMNNKNFRENVLEKIQMESKNKGNRFVTAFKSFIETITEAIFGKSSGRKKEILENGMDVLITNFSGLLGQATENKGKAQPSSDQSLAMAAINDIHNLTTEGIYNALDEGHVTPTFDDHLRSLLTSIVDKLHGPYGTFKSQIERNLVRTPKGLWDQAKKDGLVPFASEALSAPIQMNDQVAFVLEQVEVTVAGALSENKGEAHAISTELDKLYREAKTKLTGTNSPLSQELQDFMFNMKGNHLARFAALGLAHPEINEALKFGTSTLEAKASKSLSARLETLFHKVLEWFNGKMTHTHAGQQADEKLAALVNGLVSIEEKRKAPMLEKSSTLAYVESVLQSGTDKIKSKIEAAASSNLMKNSKSGIIKGAGAVVSTIAGNRTDQVIEVLQAVRDKQFRQGQGLAISMLNEVRGANDGNKMFHKLLREAKLREGNREDLIIHTSNVALFGFTNEGKDLSQKDKEALTTGVLRTDLAALLGPFDMDQITEMVGSPAARNKTVIALEKELATMKHKDFYIEQAKALAYYMVTGQSTIPHLLLNASNIAHVADTGYKVNAAEAVVAAPIIDQLVSLYALKYTDQVQLAAASKIMDAEAKRGNESGVGGIIRLHKAMQKQSKEELFSGSEALMVKGYLPEIYDPKKEVLIATEADGKSLVAQGYKKEPKHVTYDPTDPSGSTERFLYTRDGGGLRPWLSASMSFTGEVSKGGRSRSNEVKDLLDWIVNKQELASMYKAKRAAMAKGFKANPSFDPSTVKTNYAVPIMNADRQVSDYRYMMQRENKDLFLNPDNRFDKLLGSFAGNIYDKTSTKTHNREVVKALYNQYVTDFATKSVSYRVFGPNSTDLELRDMYRMLPEDTKQAIKEIWGEDEDGNSNGMLVRSDLMDITFGYRKQSVTDAFNKEKRNIAEQFFVSVATAAMGEKAAYNIRRFEDVWQELVGEAKDILVVKNVSTLLGNIGSNVSLLYWQGVPFKDMVKHHRIAMKGITNYRADSAALIELETKLKAGIVTTSKSEMQREITRLQVAINSNPVKELIDAGLMPSIVEDVAPENDMYSYKSRLVGLVDDKTSGVNKHIKGAARTLYMAKDTKAYQVLRHGTQLSDFVARYTLYQHVTTRKENPMGKEEAVQLASDSFINYDIPSHRNLQYMNDMGFVMFTKYYMRIQKVIAHLYADKPGRALAMLAFESYFTNAPMLTDSGFLHKMGNNPFTLGAFNYPGTLDELATIKAITYPFK